MLRITPCTAAGHARTYFNSADYYSQGQELTGLWRGEGARRLGLSGEVEQRPWDALCENREPGSGRRLTARQKEPRRIGWDFNFHAPKSLSLLYGLTGDERLLAAFRESVRETMQDIESEVQTRVRRNGKDQDRTSGNLVWGEFIHTTARPVGGTPDPHLHAHCFAFNATFDPVESRWKAAQIGGIKRDAPYFQALFHGRLASRLGELGLEVRRTKDAWELAGLSKETLARFSRRTAVVEQAAKDRGITDANLKAELGAKTRERKAKDLPLSQLREAWKGQLTPDESAAIRDAAASIGGAPVPEDSLAASEAIEHAAQHCFERSSVVPERVLLAEALRYGTGSTSPQGVLQGFEEAGFLRGELAGRNMATTKEVLGEEERMIAFARSGRGRLPSLGDPDRAFTRVTLSDEQKRAVRHMLGSKDRVTVVRGAAGTGKTTMAKEAVEAIERGGTKVFTFAPSAAASRGVLRVEGFAGADTVARLLIDEKLQESVRGGVLWIDEAGLLGARTMAKLFHLAEKNSARVVLVGDIRQHGSVERGAALRLLETEAGLVPAELTEIRRQEGRYKEVVNALSEGRVEEGFRGLSELGWIREASDDERYKLMAADYVEAVRKLPKGERALIVSPTHSEAARIASEVREKLETAGLIGTDERLFTVLENRGLTQAQRADPVSYQDGDSVLVFQQNAVGHKKGERIASTAESLPLDQAARFQVYRKGTLALAPGDVIRITANGTTADGRHQLHNGSLYNLKGFTRKGDLVLENGWTVSKDWGFIAQGYVVTSHAAQGRSVREVFIGQSAESFPASSAQQFYVSVSRGKRKATIYTSDKEALLEAVSRQEERTTATELVKARARAAHLERQRQFETRLPDGSRNRGHELEHV